MGKTRNKRQNSKTLRKRKRTKTARKYKGGVSFNALVGDVDKYTYSQNMYTTQLNRAPLLVDSRLQTGLPYQVGGKRRKRTQKKRMRRKKMKGGFSITGTDIFTGSTNNSNSVFAFGESGGSKYLTNRINSVKQPSGTYLGPGRVWSSIV
jgi:hypothetical protein